MTGRTITCWKCGQSYTIPHRKCPKCGMPANHLRIWVRKHWLLLAFLLVVLAIGGFTLASYLINGGSFQGQTVEIRVTDSSDVCGTLQVPAGYTLDKAKANNGSLVTNPVNSLFRQKSNFKIYAGCVNGGTGSFNAKVDEQFLRGIVLYNYAREIEKGSGRPVDISENDASIILNGMPAATAVLYYAPWQGIEEFFEYNVAVQVGDYETILLQALVLPSDWPAQKNAIDQVFHTLVPVK